MRLLILPCPPVWLEDPTAYENPKLWVDSWAKLAAAIAKVRLSTHLFI